MRRPLLQILRCPVCRGAIEPQNGIPEEIEEGSLGCLSCGESYAVEHGIPLMLSDRLPGIREKRREIAGWVEKAKSEDWYVPDEQVDTTLPYVVSRLGWQDDVWAANEYSFTRFLDRWVRPGARVLEIGAAKTWGSQHIVPRGCEYVGSDVLVDENIGIGRGAFYRGRVGHFECVQADGEFLPFADASFDVTYCVATLHHALDLAKMVGEMARVTRRGGAVAGLNEGTRPLGWSDDAPVQRGEKSLGINEHTHTAWGYVAAFARARLAVRELYPADGRLHGENGRFGIVGTLRAHTIRSSAIGYASISLVGTKL
jgi:uncharacterized protein YbaR (Trm112 family)